MRHRCCPGLDCSVLCVIYKDNKLVSHSLETGKPKIRGPSLPREEGGAEGRRTERRGHGTCFHRESAPAMMSHSCNSAIDLSTALWPLQGPTLSTAVPGSGSQPMNLGAHSSRGAGFPPSPPFQLTPILISSQNCTRSKGISLRMCLPKLLLD